jgi:hypothetical protein
MWTIHKQSQIYTPTKVKHHPIFLSIYIFLHQYCLNNKIDITIFLTPLKRLTKGSKITNLRSIYHPERRDYDVAKMGFKTGIGKT